MGPAQQSLETTDLIAFQVHQRLVVQGEFAVDQGATQIMLELAPSLHALVHLGREKSVRATSFTLCQVERQIGVLHELIRVGAIIRRNRDADACANERVMAMELE